MLQLLCEGHNSALQNVLRVQVNSEDRSKGNTFDMCIYLAKQMEQFYNVFNSQTFDVIMQLAGTIIEMIQGPCKGN